MRLLLEQTTHATELRVEPAHDEYLRRRPATLASKHAVAEPHPRAGDRSIAPLLVRERSLVELRTQPPRGEVSIHQRDELRPMIRLQLVHELVHQLVLDAALRPARKLDIQPDSARACRPRLANPFGGPNAPGAPLPVRMRPVN